MWKTRVAEKAVPNPAMWENGTTAKAAPAPVLCGGIGTTAKAGICPGVRPGRGRCPASEVAIIHFAQLGGSEAGELPEHAEKGREVGEAALQGNIQHRKIFIDQKMLCVGNALLV